MSDFNANRGLGLSLSGLRIGPVDPKSKVPRVGTHMQYQIEDPTQSRAPKFLNKDRSGFSGGFKIPADQRVAKLGRKIQPKEGYDSDDHEEVNKNDITKDEIMAQLNLGSSQAAGSSKHGTGSKSALTKDLIENLEKELEKLKRTQENIKVRKHIALGGDRSILDETEEDRQRARNKAVNDDMATQGNQVIHAGEQRIQVMRHRVGQLDSVKALPYEELEVMRQETAARLKILEEQYWGKVDNQEVGPKIRERYKQYGTDADTDAQTASPSKSSKKESGSGILKNGPQTGPEPKFDYKNLKKDGGGASRGRSRSKSLKKSKQAPLDDSPELDPTDPRQQIYEAKFEKYLANKKQKSMTDARKSVSKKEDFDIFTNGPGSPNKKGQARFKNIVDPTMPKLSGKFNPDDLIPADHDNYILMRAEMKQRKESGGDPFHNLGVSGADKMTFFLLKWVFNAIKRDSAEDDPKFQGNPFVSKADLNKQLSKNPELMHALGYTDGRQLAENVKLAQSKKDGFLMWTEFLDFFFLRNTKPHERVEGGDWWNKLDNQGSTLPPMMMDDEDDQGAEGVEGDKDKKKGSSTGIDPAYKVPQRKPVKDTPSLRLLQQSRQDRTVRDVEDEFTKMAADRKAGAKATSSPKPESKKVPEYESLDVEIMGDGFGFGREKSKNLLLNSQSAIMREIFENLDKYNEGILRRSQFVMALRTDERVIDFIDCEAVKKAYSNSTLTLDFILLEIEKDERYDQAQNTSIANEINHKEFITWREFLNYFADYQEIEARNRKQSQTIASNKPTKKDANGNVDPDEAAKNEMQTLMEQEMERRLIDLPKLRPADQIDINEKQLQLVKDIFDSLPAAPGGKGTVNVLTFFTSIRKDPQVRTINSAIARDPDGCSRIPQETFKEVFDRMERELQSKQVDWSTIVEFFTKRGRPLSKDEILKLKEEDRREKEAVDAKNRAEEDAERRRNNRIVGDLEEEEDFEAFELRQKAEQTVKDQEQAEYDKKHGNNANDQGSDDEYGDEDIERDDYEDEDDAGSTKSSPEMTNLKKAKVSQQDYNKRAQTAKSKKGKYGVTVPKPFGFDLRDKTKTKTIAERKFEAMMMEKKINEDNIIKHQFRSKPIPPEVLIPRYQSILEADAARKEAIRSASFKDTKQREAPFTFWERDMAKQKRQQDPEELIPHEMRRPSFKANPIPRASSVIIYETSMKENELKREERVKKNAEIAFGKAKMPASMQKYADRKKQMPPKAVPVEYSFMPDTGKGLSVDQLKKQQTAFAKKMEKQKVDSRARFAEKIAKEKTWAEEHQKPEKPSKILDRDYMNENTKSKGPNAMEKYLASVAKSQSGAGAKAPASTKAVAMAQLKRREELNKKRELEEANKKEEAERKIAQNKLKETVSKQYSKKFAGISSTQMVKAAVAEKRQNQKDLETKTKKDLEAWKAKGRDRPMLMDGGGGKKTANLAQLETMKVQIAIMKEFDEKFKPSEQQKELLERDELEKKFLEKRNAQKK